MPLPRSATLISTFPVSSRRAAIPPSDSCCSALERIHRVEDEVEQHLLDLYLVAAHPREIDWNGELEHDMARNRVGTHQPADVAEHLADVERQHRHLLAAEQGAYRSMTSPARWSSVLMSSRIALISCKSGFGSAGTELPPRHCAGSRRAAG
jgi:hypothetical protein